MTLNKKKLLIKNKEKRLKNKLLYIKKLIKMVIPYKFQFCKDELEWILFSKRTPKKKK